MNAVDLAVPTWLKRNALIEYFHRIDDRLTMRAIEHLSDAGVERMHAAMIEVFLDESKPNGSGSASA